MVKLVTGEEMGEIDRRTIAAGTPGAELMENAGRRVFDAIAEEWDGLEGLCPVVVCGRGNNGGDGVVHARQFHPAGAAHACFGAGRGAGGGGGAGGPL